MCIKRNFVRVDYILQLYIDYTVTICYKATLFADLLDILDFRLAMLILELRGLAFGSHFFVSTSASSSISLICSLAVFLKIIRYSKFFLNG